MKLVVNTTTVIHYNYMTLHIIKLVLFSCFPCDCHTMPLNKYFIAAIICMVIFPILGAALLHFNSCSYTNYIIRNNSTITS